MTRIKGVTSIRNLKKKIGKDVLILNEESESLLPLETNQSMNPDRVVITIEDERPPSSNVLYAGIHYMKRDSISKEKHRLIQRNIPIDLLGYSTPVKLTVIAYFSYHQMDSSNVWWAAKMYEDGLVHGGILVDDSPKYVRSLTLESRKGDRDYVEIVIERVMDHESET